MRYRTAILLAEKGLTTSGTEIVNVNIRDVISRILFSWRVSKSKSSMDGVPAKDITKVELVDGSDVLFSLDGYEIQALNLYDRRVGCLNEGVYANGNDQFSVYGIDFGRKLWDEVLALDPTKFGNLQLKISYNVALSDTGATPGYLEVFAECFDEKVVSPIGFLMSKEHWSYTKAASGFEYIDLPTDFLVRKLFVRAYTDASPAFYQVDQVRIDEDNEKRIPFNWTSTEKYLRMMRGIWVPIQEPVFIEPGLGDVVFYFTPTAYVNNAVFGLDSDAGAAYRVWNTSGKGDQFTVGSQGGTWLHGLVTGYLPHHTFEFPFGDPMDIDDWYDVTAKGSVRLRLDAGGGGYTKAAVVLEQLRRY